MHSAVHFPSQVCEQATQEITLARPTTQPLAINIPPISSLMVIFWIFLEYFGIFRNFSGVCKQATQEITLARPTMQPLAKIFLSSLKW
jgi:hypothetical protein